MKTSTLCVVCVVCAVIVLTALTPTIYGQGVPALDWESSRGVSARRAAEREYWANPANDAAREKKYAEEDRDRTAVIDAFFKLSEPNQRAVLDAIRRQSHANEKAARDANKVAAREKLKANVATAKDARKARYGR